MRDLKLEGIGSEGRNRIDGLTLKQRGEDILGELEPMDGFHGTIFAQRVEILEAEAL